MKKIVTYMFAGLIACGTLTSCLSDALDTSPTDALDSSSTLSTTDGGLIALNGIYRSMYTSGWSTSGNTHQCFGISAYNLMADVMGDDMIMASIGSGWFWYDCTYRVKDRYTSTAWRSYDLWNAYFTWINNANNILGAEKTMTGSDADKNYILGQAYAIRAYSYFMLAQSFARTYKGHESEPCVPIYTEPTQPGTPGKPRETVAKVYEQIDADIAKATELLKGTKQKHISHISYAVAEGFQARIALVEENWEKAYTSANAAIAASGASVVPVASFEGLNSVKAANVMWGAEIVADQAGMYASLFSHMDAEAGYYGKTARKQINKDLYNLMDEKDERRNWWTEDKKTSGGYQQEKFKFADVPQWTGDYIWMRVEEMYLTAAEAYCRAGNDAEARKMLEAVMEKRITDPTDYAAYKAKLNSLSGNTLPTLTTPEQPKSLLEEIINERRIELWGEIGRIYDIRRLKQGFKRSTEQGWPTQALLTGRPTDDPENYMWVFTIPQSEFDGNASLDATKDQNPTGDK